MCGINGIINLTDQRTNLMHSIHCMNEHLSHRGPDDSGVYQDQNTALGHHRLSIIDLSDRGHQPMSDDSGRYVIVFNGEIYNFREVKSKLYNYNFKSNTDTEVLLVAYMQWGEYCLNYLNGMFAFAIWDSLKKKLFVARDRMGIKPFYYYLHEDTLFFSSEIRALLASGIVKRKIDRQSLIEYLRYQTVHAPYTLIEGINMLKPGHFAFFSYGNFKQVEYWSVNSKLLNGSSDTSEINVQRHVKKLFYEAVEKRLNADVPFGAFLSGGIDSTAIVAAMHQFIPGRINTFSIIFNENKFDESKYAKIIADKYNTSHHQIMINPGDLVPLVLEALNATDHPSGDGINTYIISKLTKKNGVDMALSGLGGDELFGGYASFKRLYKSDYFRLINILPAKIRKMISGAFLTPNTSIRNRKVLELLQKEKLNLKHAWFISRQVLMDSQIANMLTYEESLFDRPLNNHEEIQIEDHIISMISILEIELYMQNVLLRDTDQMSMSHALEVRVPFLDHDFVEFIIGLKDQYKYPGSKKKLLIKSLEPEIPIEIWDRPKMGFTLPFSVWMKNDIKSFCEERIWAFSKRDGISKDFVQSSWNGFLNSKMNISWSRIWHIIALENWLQLNKVEF